MHRLLFANGPQEAAARWDPDVCVYIFYPRVRSKKCKMPMLTALVQNGRDNSKATTRHTPKSPTIGNFFVFSIPPRNFTLYLPVHYGELTERPKVLAC